MNSQLFHNSMDTVTAVIRVIKMIDPVCHASIAKDMTESFIVFFYQFGYFLIFFLVLWYFSVQPLIVGSTSDFQLPAHPVNAPGFLFVEILNSHKFRLFTLFSKPHIPSNSFTFLTVLQTCPFLQADVSNAGFHDGDVPVHPPLHLPYGDLACQQVLPRHFHHTFYPGVYLRV